MKPLVAIAILFSTGGALLSSAQASTPVSCEMLVRKARQLLLRREAESAVEQLATLLSQKDRSQECRDEARLVLAEAQEQLGFYQEAAEHWRRLWSQGPTEHRELDVLRGLARIERKLGRFSESLKALERLAERLPNSIRVRLDMLETKQAMGDELGAARKLVELRASHIGTVGFDYYRRFRLQDAAVSYLETLHEAGQATVFERMELARLHRARGDHQAALETALALEEESPDSAELQALLGSLYLNIGELDRSMLHYERSLDLDEGRNISFLEGLGTVFFQKGERDKAIRLWHRIAPAETPHPQRILDLARIFREHGLYEEALELLIDLPEKIRERLSAQHSYIRQLTDTYYIVGRAEKALGLLLEMAQQRPAQLGSMTNILQGMLAEDMHLCEFLPKLQPSRQNWSSHLFLAQGLEFCGEHFDATKHYLQSYLARNQMDAVATLLAQLVHEERYEEAAWLEDRLAGTSLRNVHLLYYRGVLAEKRGDFERAERLFRSYLQSLGKERLRDDDRGLRDDALFHLANLLLGSLDRPGEAYELFAELIIHHPNSSRRPQAEACLGLALFRVGRVEEAVRHLDIIGPTNPLALALLGRIHLARSEIDQARVTLREALTEYPDRLGSHPELLSLLTAIRLAIASEEAAHLVCEFHRALLLDDLLLAESTLRELERHDAWWHYARFERAELTRRQGRLPEAVELYSSLSGPEQPDWLAVTATFRLVELTLQQGRPKEAIQVLESSILHHSQSPRLAELRQKLVELKAEDAPPAEATP